MTKIGPVCVVLLAGASCNQAVAQSEPLLMGQQQRSEVRKASTQEQKNKSEVEWRRATGALDSDCSHSGKNPDGSFEFMVPCPAAFPSPDGRWEIVMGREAPEGGAPVTIRRGDGTYFATISELSDGMPLTVFWSPRPNWFLVNHHAGSFMRKPEVYEITRSGVVRHRMITLEGLKQAQRISPCLPNRAWDWAGGWAAGWSKDGRKVAWLFVTRTDACVDDDHDGPIPPDKQWKPFWMISDAETGAIVPGSVRILEGDEPAQLPRDAAYKEFAR